MPLAVLPAQSRELFVASNILLTEFLVVGFQLVVIGKHPLRGCTLYGGSADFGCSGFSSKHGALLYGLEFFAQTRDHALKPFDVIPSLLLFVYCRAVFYVTRAICILERIDCFGGIPLDRANAGDHKGVGISTEGVLQKAGKLGVAVWNVRCGVRLGAGRVAEGRYDIAQC